MREMNSSDIIRGRLTGNGLGSPFPDPLACVRALAGIQAQFQQWAEVSIMNRCPAGLTVADLEELYHRHDLINLWGQRHTLHTYVKEDWDAVSGIYLPILLKKNFAHNRFPDDFAFLLERVACSLEDSMPRTRLRELIEKRMQDRHTENDYFENTFLAVGCLRGLFFGLPAKPAVRTFIGRRRAMAEPWREREADLALQEFILRYFRHYGPATLSDFCHWSGLPQGTAKPCLTLLKDRLTIYAHAGREYFVEPGGEAILADAGTNDVFLLGKFDPLFVSYKHKDWIIPEKLQKRVWRSAGWVEGVILADGKAMGTWRHTVKGGTMSLRIEPFGKIAAATRKKIGRRAERLAKFWGKGLDTIVFV